MTATHSLSRYQTPPYGRSCALRLMPMLGLMLVALAAAGCHRDTAAIATPEDFLQQHGITYALEVRTAPRPLRIHRLKIDMSNPRIELATALADDPDGDGPATAKLTPPMSLAARANAIVFVNANPWMGMSDAQGKRQSNWTQDLSVEILGLAVSGGTVRCPARKPNGAFWIDTLGKPHIGQPEDIATVREGVAGFLLLLVEGSSPHQPGGKPQPRTAIGLDASSRWLYLVLVDGRQDGYSEGMSYAELADYMKEIGCRWALNLDGGGSSIMILADDKGERRVINDPSTKENGVSVARPIPVGLAIREKQPPAGR